MRYMDTYSENCDYLRERFELSDATSIYELVGKAVEAIQELEVELTKKLKSQKEKRNVGRPKKRKSNSRNK